MLNIKSIVKIPVTLTRCLATVVVVLCLTACDSESPEYVESPEATDGGVLSMNIMAAQVDHTTTGLEYGLDFENQISFNTYDNTFRFLIYHGDSNDTDAPCIFDIDYNNLYKGWSFYGMPDIGYRCIIDVDRLKFTTRPSPDEPVTLTVVCLANIFPTKPEKRDNVVWVSDKTNFSTLGNVLKSGIAFQLSDSWYPGTAGTSSVGLPMFGMITTTIPAGMLFNGIKYPIIEIDETIWMLRSTAKLMLIDALKKDDNGYPRICLDNNYLKPNDKGNKIELPKDKVLSSNGSFYNVGRMIPVNFQNGVNVSTPSINRNSLFKVTPLTRLIAKTDIEVDGETRTCDYIPFYFPEQTLHDGISDTKEIYIPVELAEGKVERRTLVLDDFYNAFDNALLRNHVYRIAVTGLKQPQTRAAGSNRDESELTVTAEVVSPTENGRLVHNYLHDINTP